LEEVERLATLCSKKMADKVGSKFIGGRYGDGFLLDLTIDI
jgi:hypothetical protein